MKEEMLDKYIGKSVEVTLGIAFMQPIRGILAKDEYLDGFYFMENNVSGGHFSAHFVESIREV